MRKADLPVLALTSVLLWVACDTRQPTQPVDLDPSFAISDAVHDGNAHFYWLPPMVPAPTTVGTFMGTLSPTVVICDWTSPPMEPCSPGGPTTKWVFTRYEGPGSERVLVDVHGQHYQLNWRTADYKDPAVDSYRISVWLEATELGHADVLIDANAKVFRHLDQTIGLIDGSTLPIKFRIESEMFDIAFHSDREGSYDVHLMNRQTGAHANISNHPALDGMPSWSPDGRKIAFSSDRESSHGGPDLYVMDADGENVTRLTWDGGWKPAWSPDGSTIAFQRGWPPSDTHQDIWIMDAGGGNEQQLTDVPPDPTGLYYEDVDPTWHPTENWVTFARTLNGEPDDCLSQPAKYPICDFDIVSIDVSTREEVRHTFARDWDQTSPAWSPDGRYLLYSAQGPLSNSKFLWVEEVPGGSPIQLTVAPPFVEIEDQEADWSDDGTMILFTRLGPAATRIFVGFWHDWIATVPPPAYHQIPINEGAWARFRPIAR